MRPWKWWEAINFDFPRAIRVCYKLIQRFYFRVSAAKWIIAILLYAEIVKVFVLYFNSTCGNISKDLLAEWRKEGTEAKENVVLMRLTCTPFHCARDVIFFSFPRDLNENCLSFKNIETVYWKKKTSIIILWVADEVWLHSIHRFCDLTERFHFKFLWVTFSVFRCRQRWFVFEDGERRNNLYLEHFRESTRNGSFWNNS